MADGIDSGCIGSGCIGSADICDGCIGIWSSEKRSSVKFQASSESGVVYRSVEYGWSTEVSNW